MITASSYDRPKTSRAKQRPTPDEFTDYVVPSPPPQHKKSVLEHHSSVYVIQVRTCLDRYSYDVRSLNVRHLSIYTFENKATRIPLFIEAVTGRSPLARAGFGAFE
jgi:hypothetical protein